MQAALWYKPVEQMENLLFLGVPILKHIRVCKQHYDINQWRHLTNRAIFIMVNLSTSQSSLEIASIGIAW